MPILKAGALYPHANICNIFRPLGNKGTFGCFCNNLEKRYTAKEILGHIAQHRLNGDKIFSDTEYYVKIARAQLKEVK